MESCKALTGPTKVISEIIDAMARENNTNTLAKEEECLMARGIMINPTASVSLHVTTECSSMVIG